MKNKLKLLVPVAVLATASLASAQPIDVEATGTTVAGYIAGAAGAGLAIMTALYGIRVIIRAFKSVK